MVMAGKMRWSLSEIHSAAPTSPVIRTIHGILIHTTLTMSMDKLAANSMINQSLSQSIDDYSHRQYGCCKTIYLKMNCNLMMYMQAP